MFALKKLSSSKWVSGEGHGARNYGQPLVMESIQLTTSKKPGTSVLQMRDEFCP